MRQIHDRVVVKEWLTGLYSAFPSVATKEDGHMDVRKILRRIIIGLLGVAAYLVLVWGFAKFVISLAGL